MGAYLEKPITEKHTEGDENGWIRYAATSMQGWRINQEDAHNCILDFDADCSLFAVYDGHGGSEVAQYTADNLPALLKSSETWKAKKYADAIEESFLEFDDHLRSEEVLADLKVMAGLHEKSQDHEHSDDEDKVALYEEAGMPLESILERYGFSLTKGRNGEPVLNIEEVNSARERRDKSPVDGEIEDTKSENANDVKSNRLLEGRNGKREDDTMKSSEKTDSGTVELAKKRFSGSPILKSPKRSKKSNGEHDRRSSQSESQSPGTDEKCVEKIDPCRSERSSRSESDANEVANESNGIVSVAMSSDDKDEPSILSAQPHPSISPENNVGLSSDSEQSVDEDYNEDEEMSEEDDSDQDEDAEMYGGPAGDTPGEDSGTTACVALVFKDKIIVGNVGDSRAVLCRSGNALELSLDHKPEDEIEKKRIEAAGGQINLDGRVNGGLNLSRALGDHSYKKNTDLPLRDQMISALPDVTEQSIEKTDEFIVIACDGIWNSLTSQEVVDFVRKEIEEEVTLRDICEKICDKCLSPNTSGDGTGCDNMTIIIVQFLRH